MVFEIQDLAFEVGGYGAGACERGISVGVDVCVTIFVTVVRMWM